MIARRIINAVIAWWMARRVERRAPELAALRKAEAEARRQHKPVKHIRETRRAIVRNRLIEETSRRTA